MLSRLVVTFLVSFLVGCVTVTDKPNTVAFDAVKASEARITLGLNYLREGDRVRARENLEKAVAFAPKYYRAQTSMAYYYQQVGENKQAEKHYRLALSSSPRNGDVLNNYGAFLCGVGRFEQADQYFKQAIEQPYYYLVAASYENAGLCAVKAQQPQKAADYFRRALDHDPGRTQSSMQLARLEIEQNQFSDARIRLLQFNQRYGYQSASLGLLIELEKKAGNQQLVQQYAGILKDKYPNSIQYQKYIANEY